MTDRMEKLNDFAAREGAALNAEFNEILASFNPPKPLHVEQLILKEPRTRDKGTVVYEDDECIIIMDG